MNVLFDFGSVLFKWRPLELVAQVFAQHALKRQAANADWMDFDRGVLDRHRVAARTAHRLSLDLQRVTALVDSVEAAQALGWNALQFTSAAQLRKDLITLLP
jgi:putative hydrolase of the HAD superfamily